METKQDITQSNLNNSNKKCSKCNSIKKLDEFPLWKEKRRSQCKACVAEKSRLWRIENPSYATEYMKDYLKNNKETMYAQRDKKRQEIAEWKRIRGCVLCGESEPCCLDMHHLDPTEKEMTPSKTATLGQFLKEAHKCVLLCSNCHRKVHANLVTISIDLIKKFQLSFGHNR